MNKVVLWIWCFPQMVAGLLVKLITRAEKNGNHYKYHVAAGSVSLGEYIFLCPSHCGDERMLKHEQGHSVQSRFLGWLYVPIILIPSLIWAGCFEWYRKKYNVSYYAFYTERWADKISGVGRYHG